MPSNFFFLLPQNGVGCCPSANGGPVNAIGRDIGSESLDPRFGVDGAESTRSSAGRKIGWIVRWDDGAERKDGTELDSWNPPQLNSTAGPVVRISIGVPSALPKM